MQSLKTSGYRTQIAYPGRRIPVLESMAVAVQLAQTNQKEETATVLVSVLVPARMGGGACEDGAVDVCRVLRDIGGNCTQNKVEYFSDMEVFCVKITAEFRGMHTENGWQAAVTEQDFTVMIEGTVLPYVRSFQAFRDGIEGGLSVAGLPWRFRMEEVYPLNAIEPELPTEGFDLVVIRKNRRETFCGCTLQYQNRTIKSDGQHQTWEGFCWSWSYE